MGTRIELQEQLEEIGEVSGHVYFQPPVNLVMSYPCIVYSLEGEYVNRADDLAYRRKRNYTITVIDKNPDSTIPDQVADIFQARMERHFVNDHLHHFVYSIYY